MIIALVGLLKELHEHIHRAHQCLAHFKHHMRVPIILRSFIFRVMSSNLLLFQHLKLVSSLESGLEIQIFEFFKGF